MIYFFVRKQGGKEDILSRFLIDSNTDPENMTDKYLRDITLSFVIAGKDTSAGTLTWFFYMLCKHPLIQEKAAQEVRAATKTENNPCTDKFHDNLTEAALDKMQYLHAALTETLRLYPAVPVVKFYITSLFHLCLISVQYNMEVIALQFLIKTKEFFSSTFDEP